MGRSVCIFWVAKITLFHAARSEKAGFGYFCRRSEL